MKFIQTIDTIIEKISPLSVIRHKLYKDIPKANNDYKNNKIGWLNLALLSPIFFMWFWILATFTASISVTQGSNPALAQLFYSTSGGNQLSGSQLTVFTSLFLIGNVFTVIPVALFVDRFSIRRVINIFLIVAIISLIGLLLSFQNYPLACFFAFLMGVSAGVCVVPFLKIAFQWFKPKDVAFPIAFFISIGLFGGIVLNFIATELTKVHFTESNSIFGILPGSANRSGGFIILLTIIMEIVVFFLSLFVVEKERLIKKHYIGLEKYGNNLVKALKKPQNISIPLIIGLMNLPVSVIVWSLHTQVFIYFGDRGSSSTQNFIISTLLIGNFIGSFVFGYISDWIGKRKPLLIVANIILTAITFLLLIRHLSPNELFVVFFLIGFFCSAQNIGYPMLTEQNHAEISATENSWNSMILLSCGAIIQNVFSSIAGSLPGNENAITAIPTWLLALIPILMIIPIFLSFTIVETGPKNKNKKALEFIINTYSFKETFKHITLLGNLKKQAI